MTLHFSKIIQGMTGRKQTSQDIYIDGLIYKEKKIMSLVLLRRCRLHITQEEIRHQSTSYHPEARIQTHTTWTHYFVKNQEHIPVENAVKLKVYILPQIHTKSGISYQSNDSNLIKSTNNIDILNIENTTVTQQHS